MQYIHVKNLEKHHPGYTERTLIWCRTYFTMLNSDPEFEMIPEIDKWRFVSFIMLELQLKKPIPINENYLIRKGFDLKARPIAMTLKVLHTFIDIVTTDVTQSRVSKSRVKLDKSRYVLFEDLVIKLWNDFSLQHPSISKIEKISETRRKHLKNRFESSHFKEKLAQVIQDIPKYPFLMGKNKSGWRISFDWLIANDNNYVKILEKKYDNATEKTGIEKYIVE